MADDVKVGTRLKTILGDGETLVITYDLVDPAGTIHADAATIRIPFAALDLIDQRLGGTEPLTLEQRIDLVAKFLRPLTVWTFTRREASQAPPPQRQDVTVNAHGSRAGSVAPPGES